MIQSVLVTVLCCLPLGIVAVVKAAEVNSKLAAGDVAGAMAASQQAKKLCTIGFGVGLVVIFIYVVIGLAGGFR
jgi:hypothetical protein